jgi:hypothetical protein
MELYRLLLNKRGMARTIKIDNSLQKRFAYKSKKKKSKDIVVHFLIVCEGKKTEPNYFKCFPSTVGKIVYDIQFDGGGISTKKVVEKAIELRNNSPQGYTGFGLCLIKTVFRQKTLMPPF